MQEHPKRARIFRIRVITNNGMPYGRHVQPQLVTSPRVRHEPHERAWAAAVRSKPQPASRGHRRHRSSRLAARVDLLLEAPLRDSDPRCDLEFIPLWPAEAERCVDLVALALTEEL